MNIRPTPIAAAIASLLACSLLAACGGGGGGGMVRSPEPSTPPPLPPPPPPPPPAGACPMPITGDCVVTPDRELQMLGGRDSAHALRVRLSTGYGDTSLTLGSLSFRDGPETERSYSFAGGTVVESGGLIVEEANTLRSSVQVLKNGSLDARGRVAGTVANQGFVRILGEVQGAVSNHGFIYLFGTIVGDVHNDGTLDADANPWSGAKRQILGHYTASPTSTTSITLCPAGWDCESGLNVSGQARISGALLLHEYTDAWGPYVPASGTHQILRADGGVFGTFERWTSPGLFIEGSLRYGSHDVWFDLTRISVATAMASNGIGSPLTLASAANLDRAFARTDGFALALPGSLTSAQDRMLVSAGSVLRIADIAQATRTLDSLSGATHVDALQASLQQGIADPAVGQRLAAMHPGFAAGAWLKTHAGGNTSGFDQWLSPRLLVGVQAGQGSDHVRDTFGQSSRLSPQAGAYLRWFGEDGWFAGGSAGYAQHTLALDRTLDLARGGQWNAHARQRFNVAGVQGEAGRRLSFVGGTLTPYVALDATALRSERTIEQGRTGFELALQPAMQAQLGAGLGLRFGREWRLGDSGWLRLEADARMQRRLADAGDPLRAAFVGVPDLWFDLPSHANRTAGRLDLGLRGGFGRDWSWSFAHTRSLGTAHGAVPDWSLGLRRTF